MIKVFGWWDDRLEKEQQNDGNDDKINEEDPSAHEEMASQRFQFENDDSYAALMQRR